jgi:uncharacterized membrane protein YeaQ/YmgE (transglycosylase-associated protein family)
MSFEQIIVWLIVGALAGSLAAWVIKGQKKGYGPIGNILIGLVGAVIGGYLFETFDIDLGLGALTVTGEDLVAAFIGSLLLLGVISYLQRR